MKGFLKKKKRNSVQPSKDITVEKLQVYNFYPDLVMIWMFLKFWTLKIQKKKSKNVSSFEFIHSYERQIYYILLYNIIIIKT